jgi:hypothetical protein
LLQVHGLPFKRSSILANIRHEGKFLGKDAEYKG